MQLMSTFFLEVLLERVLGTIWAPLIMAIAAVYVLRRAALSLLSHNPELSSSLAKSILENPLSRYIRWLGLFLDRTRGLIYYSHGKKRNIASIYTRFIAIALGYTVVLFFIAWGTGGDGRVGEEPIIVPQYTLTSKIVLIFCFLFFALFVLRSVTSPNSIDQTLLPIFSGNKNRYHVTLALMGAIAVFLSQYISADRVNLIGQINLIIIQVGLSLLAAYLILYVSEPIRAFSFIITASFALSVGIPIIIGIPLGIALVSINAGIWPVIVSVIAVPVLMYQYFYVDFSSETLRVLSLGFIACFPVLIAAWFQTYRTTGLIATVLFGIAALLPVYIPVSFSSNQVSEPMAFGILIFWCVLPILNAVWDALSWAASWFLLSHLRTSLSRDDRTHGLTAGWKTALMRVVRRVSTISAHILADFLLAIIFLLAVFSVVVAAIEISNSLIADIRPQYIVNIEGVIEDMLDQPWAGNGFWLASLIFSTLLPTFVHFLLAFLALFMLAAAPIGLEESLKNLADEDAPEEKRKHATYWVVTRGAFLFAMGTLLFFGLWIAFWTTLSPIGFTTMILDIQETVSAFISKLFG